VSIEGIDLQGHLVGVQAVMQASVADMSSAPNNDFRRACVLSAFRQELYICFMEQRPLRCEAPLYLIERRTEDDDWSWAQKAVFDCAAVVDYVFGDHPKTIARTSQLADQIKAWRAHRPITFEPLGTPGWLRDEGACFADVPLLAPCHGRL